MTEIHDLSALELAAAVRRREVSPTEVADHTLDRAQRWGATLGAFAALTPDLARAQAASAERAVLRSTDPLPPLFGVPCPIKDLAQVKGTPFRAGSAAIDETSEVDDGVATRLREAGTLMIGKTSTPEFGLPPYTEPDIGPPARTPWDLDRTAGGSSGGAGAAVGARIVPIAHGSDGGGSIRIPASACGLVGLKPSRGVVSPGPHRVDGAGLGVNGVLSRDVRDTAAGLDALTGPWPGDTFLPPVRTSSYLEATERPPAPLRIGVLTTPVITDDAVVDPVCLAAVEVTAAALEAAGHRIDAAPRPFAADRWMTFQAIWSVSALQAPVDDADEALLTPLTRWLRDSGRGVSGLSLAEATAGVQLLTREVAARWQDFDLILTPTLARPPVMVGEIRDDADPAADFAAQMAWTPWTSVWNLTGWAAISVPVHRADVGGRTVPIGVMLGATRPFDDATLLAVAAQLEQALPWRDTYPQLT